MQYIRPPRINDLREVEKWQDEVSRQINTINVFNTKIINNIVSGIGIPYQTQDEEEGESFWLIPIPGPAGTSIQGPSGLSIPGRDGEDAWPIPGIQGLPGLQGVMGIPGKDGEDGEDAPIIPGRDGVPGSIGADGLQGLIGIPGQDGEDGLDGWPIIGPKGADGSPGGGGLRGTTTLDFGATPTDAATKNVTGLSGLTIGTHKEAFVQGDDSIGDNDVDAHKFLAVSAKFSCEYISATEMKINCDLLMGLATGQFTIHWVTA